jgi:LemA protein
MTVTIIVAIVVGLFLLITSVYNKCVKLKNQGEEAYAQIDTHLKQRYDLIPNLVETVKGYASHEQKTLTAVIEARNKAMSAGTIEEKDKADNAFAGTLKSLFALSEAYPELKANTNFTELQKQLTALEKDILQARKYYNAVVKTFNTTIETFPTSLVVKIFGGKFKKMSYLEVANEERQNVKVNFNN